MERDLVKEPQDMETLERLIDRYSLANVVEALVAICGEKAAHLRADWQDDRSARAWDIDARNLDRVVAKLRNAG